MKLWTIQLGQWRLAKQKNIPMVNTTVMSGLPWLAPTWEMVKGHKAKILSDIEYTVEYVPMMALSQHVHREEWLQLAQMEEVAIACYCGEGNFCHRLLLVEIFKEFCEQEGIEFTYIGELNKGTA